MCLQVLVQYILENTHNIMNAVLGLSVQWYAKMEGLLPWEGAGHKGGQIIPGTGESFLEEGTLGLNEILKSRS